MYYGIYDYPSGTTLIARFAAPVTVKSNQPTFSNDSFSLKRSVRTAGAQRWEITANIEPLATGADELFSQLVVKGHAQTFLVTMPQNFGSVSRTTQTNALSVNATTVAGSSTVTLKAASNSLKVAKGTFITFASSSKVYMLTEDLTFNNTTTANAKIFPSLRTAVSANEAVVYSGTKMLCYYDTDTIVGMQYSDGILMDLGSVKLIEAL